MPVIKRDDGVQFAVYTYRELLTAKRPSFLKQEIYILQTENGDYCRFFPEDTGDYEAVFSREEGYLLAETVWDHFGKPHDFIYCETLPDGLNAILVVVRAGSISLDAEVFIENLPDEFATLVTGSNEYDIYIYGNIPLSAHPEEGFFSFETSFVKSFTVLENPVFPTLEPKAAYKLLTVPKAIDELHLGGERIPLIIVIVVLIAALGAAYWVLKPSAVEEKLIIPKVVYKSPKEPYAEYRKLLTSPAPANILKALAKDVQQLFTLPGWLPKKISFNDKEVKVSLESMGGTTEMLLAWSRSHKTRITAEKGKAELTMPFLIPNRVPPKAIYNISDLVTKAFDRLKQSVPEGSIAIAEVTPKKNYAIASIEITFNGITSDVLILYGTLLAGLPANIVSGDFTVEEGLLTGKISIQVVGAKS